MRRTRNCRISNPLRSISWRVLQTDGCEASPSRAILVRNTLKSHPRVARGITYRRRADRRLGVRAGLASARGGVLPSSQRRAPSQSQGSRRRAQRGSGVVQARTGPGGRLAPSPARRPAKTALVGQEALKRACGLGPCFTLGGMGQRTGNTKPVDELEGRLNPLLEGIARAECVWVARPVEMSPWLRLSRRSLLAGGLHESAQRLAALTCRSLPALARCWLGADADLRVPLPQAFSVSRYRDGVAWRPLLLGREAVEARRDVVHKPVTPASRVAPAARVTVTNPVEGVADPLTRASPHRRR
jgi:hypothetical protein